MGRFLGIFINPAFVQYEGLDRVFDNLQSAGATAVVTHPGVARPAADGKGGRFPPLHTDGYNRVLGRELWGKRELHLQTFRAFDPDPALYADTAYAPTARPVPDDMDREVPARIIAEAHKRGMQAHVQISPFQPPGVRPEDRPICVDGAPPRGPLVANVACLNSPQAHAYALAAVRDLLAHYPDADGLFMDWVEYDAYGIEGCFTCFCPHCEAAANGQGFDWARIKGDTMRLWDWLHALTPRELVRSRRVMRNPSELLERLTDAPGVAEFLRFKADTVVGFYRQVRDMLNGSGRPRRHMSARGWPPPWNRSSGMDYRRLATICDAVTPKLFTFDYCALPRWYGQTLLDWNPDLPQAAILDALVEWMNLPDDIENRSFAHYNIPAPGERHPAKLESYRARIEEVAAQIEGRARCLPFAHAYLPEPQWEEMLALLRDSPADGIWVQMYGYLSDTKLDILRRVWRTEAG
ncbi:MAG: hypothetical protein JXR37_32195 [Kiritimatiellae bacterium]|nr:hypothetical protein [Kiritimatiellia bacterium]